MKHVLFALVSLIVTIGCEAATIDLGTSHQGNVYISLSVGTGNPGYLSYACASVVEIYDVTDITASSQIQPVAFARIEMEVPSGGYSETTSSNACVGGIMASDWGDFTINFVLEEGRHYVAYIGSSSYVSGAYQSYAMASFIANYCSQYPNFGSTQWMPPSFGGTGSFSQYGNPYSVSENDFFWTLYWSLVY